MSRPRHDRRLWLALIVSLVWGAAGAVAGDTPLTIDFIGSRPTASGQTFNEDSDPVTNAAVQQISLRNWWRHLEVHDDRNALVRPFPGVTGLAAVWTHVQGGNRDIAYSEFRDGRWQQGQRLVGTPSREQGPKLTIAPDSTIHVVYWSDDGFNQRIMHLQRDPASERWSEPAQISLAGEQGRRPYVAMRNGTLWIAYERDARPEQAMVQRPTFRSRPQLIGAPVQEVVGVAIRGGVEIARGAIARTARAEPLDVRLEVRRATMWASWKQQSDVYAWAELEGMSWAAPQELIWNEGRPASERAIHRLIERHTGRKQFGRVR